MEFKSLLKKSALFIIIFISLDYVYGVLCDKILSGKKFELTYALNETKDDVIIVGSSESLCHYNPNIISDSLNMSVYNFASNAKGIYYYYPIINSILDRYKPKCILIGTSTFDCDSTAYLYGLGSLQSYRKYHNKNKYADEMLALLGVKEEIKLMSSFYRYNSLFMPIYIFQSYFGKMGTFMNENKGFEPLSGEMLESPKTYVNKIHVRDTLRIEYFEKVIKRLKAEGVYTIILKSPIYRNVMEKEESLAPIKNIAKKYNIPYWDYTKDTTFLNNNKLFRDSYHLNNNGATFYSKKVAKRLKSIINMF